MKNSLYSWVGIFAWTRMTYVTRNYIIYKILYNIYLCEAESVQLKPVETVVQPVDVLDIRTYNICVLLSHVHVFKNR